MLFFAMGQHHDASCSREKSMSINCNRGLYVVNPCIILVGLRCAPVLPFFRTGCTVRRSGFDDPQTPGVTITQ